MFQNIANEKMEMTTPVITRRTTSAGEKMEMTTPVITRRVRIAHYLLFSELSLVLAAYATLVPCFNVNTFSELSRPIWTGLIEFMPKLLGRR